MTPTVKSLGINLLNREQRIALVLEIWDSIAAESLPTVLTENQKDELKRRMVEDDTNPGDDVPWEEVKAQTLERFK